MNRTRLVGVCGILTLSTLTMITPTVGAIPAPITGTVFRDYNHNGSSDAGEPPLAGATVTATAPDGASLSATTAENGTYSITGTDDQLAYSIEFSWDEPWLKAGLIGTDSGARTQFKTGGEIANFSVVNPADYCEVADSELGYATTCFVLGDPVAPSEYAGRDTLVSMHGQATGIAADPAADPVEPGHVADNTTLGSTYGLAWQPSTEFFYASATLKRHVGLGTGGIDAIYQVDTSQGAGTSAALWYSAIDAGSGVVQSALDRGMPTTLAAPTSVDALAFEQIYKVGWGDIDISPDEQTLYAVNLFDRSLYAIDIAEANAGSTTAHTNLGSPAHTCPGGAQRLSDPTLFDAPRPFALEILDGEVWMSVTCTAETSDDGNDLRAAIYAFDTATQTWSATPAIDFALNYSKGCLSFLSGCGYEPWTDVYSEANFNYVANPGSPYDIPMRPQPMVSDIEIDRDGYMTIGIRDRQGDQFGHRNLSPLDNGDLLTGAGAGDLLLASNNADGTWTLESGGAASIRTSSGTGTGISGPGGPASGQGPGGGEFYWGEYVLRLGSNAHSETALGSLALAPGRTEIAATNTDPIDELLDAAGVSWFELANGAENHAYQLFRDSSTPAPPVSGKANALGDLEAMCPPAPVQIGNRVWFDADNDGIQDPGEPSMPGVLITIADEDPGTPDVQVTTDAQGSWFYLGAANTKYSITFDASAADVSGISEVSSAAELAPTAMDQGPANNLDSDMDPNTRMLMHMTGPPASNNHTLDAGFTVAGLEIGNLVWYDLDNNGIAESTEGGIPNVAVELWLDSNADGTPDTLVAQTTTDADGHYNFAGLEPGIYCVLIPDQSALGQPLQGYGSSTPTQPVADNNADNDDNGIDPAPSPGPVKSGFVTLSAGAEPNDETARSDDPTADVSPTGVTAADSNLSIDFGFYQLASIGSVVWFDLNNDGAQDANETMVPSVTVQLLDAAGALVGTTTTDENGAYAFHNLPVGDYVVCFDLTTVPEGYKATTPNTGGDGIDSDASANGKTASFAVGAGDQNFTLALGIVPGTAVRPKVQQPDNIPRTGNDATQTMLLVGSLSVLMGSVLLITRRRLLALTPARIRHNR